MNIWPASITYKEQEKFMLDTTILTDKSLERNRTESAQKTTLLNPDRYDINFTKDHHEGETGDTR